MKDFKNIISLLSVVMLAGCADNWDYLYDVYGVSGNQPVELSSGHSILVYRQGGESLYLRGNGVVKLEDASIYLAKYVPVMGNSRPVRIPVSDIVDCEKDNGAGSWSTKLTLKDDVFISIEPLKLDIYGWCMSYIESGVDEQ